MSDVGDVEGEDPLLDDVDIWFFRTLVGFGRNGLVSQAGVKVVLLVALDADDKERSVRLEISVSNGTTLVPLFYSSKKKGEQKN